MLALRSTVSRTPSAARPTFRGGWLPSPVKTMELGSRRRTIYTSVSDPRTNLDVLPIETQTVIKENKIILTHFKDLFKLKDSIYIAQEIGIRPYQTTIILCADKIDGHGDFDRANEIINLFPWESVLAMRGSGPTAWNPETEDKLHQLYSLVRSSDTQLAVPIHQYQHGEPFKRQFGSKLELGATKFFLTPMTDYAITSPIVYKNIEEMSKYTQEVNFGHITREFSIKMPRLDDDDYYSRDRGGEIILPKRIFRDKSGAYYDIYPGNMNPEVIKNGIMDMYMPMFKNGDVQTRIFLNQKDEVIRLYSGTKVVKDSSKLLSGHGGAGLSGHSGNGQGGGGGSVPPTRE